MSRSNSFNKRELEKSKQKKRLEKQKRKEARKQQAPDSFDDMIAYVDEFGNITDTPPDPAKVEEVNVEDIEISIPPKAEEENQGLTGVVDFFNEEKGFGFIKENNSNNSYFFHQSNANEGIKKGDKVTYKLERSPRGMNAVEVEILK